VTQYMFDHSWYEKIENVVKEIAQWSAIGWICGLWNRHPQYMHVCMEPNNYERSFIHTATGFILESSIYYYQEKMGSTASRAKLSEDGISFFSPFPMEESNIKAILGLTSNSLNIFNETLEYCLNLFTESPMCSQHILNSVFLFLHKNASITTLSTVDRRTEAFWLYTTNRTMFGDEHLESQSYYNSNEMLVAKMNQYYEQNKLIGQTRIQIEKQKESSIGDYLFYKLVKRRVKLQKQLEQERIRSITSLKKEDDINQPLEEIEPNIYSTASIDSAEEEMAATRIESGDVNSGMKILKIGEFMDKCHVDVLQRVMYQFRSMLSSHHLTRVE
jgi:hypothetical protein